MANNYAVGVALLGVVAVWGCKEKSAPAVLADVFTEVRAARPGVTVTASDLVLEYRKNEVAGDLKYKGKTLRVTGPFMIVQKDAPSPGLQSPRRSQEVILSMDPTERPKPLLSMFVHCHLDADDSDQMRRVAGLEHGVLVSVVGKGAGQVGGDVTLDGCRIEEAPRAEVKAVPRPSSSGFSLGRVIGTESECAALTACCSGSDRPITVEVACSSVQTGGAFPDCAGNLRAVRGLYTQAKRGAPDGCEVK